MVDIITRAMTSEEQKFRAETFRILGIALITPLGKVLLDPWIFFQEHNLVYSIIYIIIAVASSYVGLIHIERARVILDERGRSKWMN